MEADGMRRRDDPSVSVDGMTRRLPDRSGARAVGRSIGPIHDGYRWWRVRKFFHLVLSIVVSGVLLAGVVVALVPSFRELGTATLLEPEEIDLAALDGFAVRSQVFAADGSLLSTLHGPENREPVSLEQVPQPVIDSILAVEDADFYNHRGVNVRAVVRAMLSNLSAGSIEQGGSTITQQLVKNALVGSDRDLHRKTKEAAYALRLERRLSKDEILEKYLNTVYFGSGAYGVQAAAETYWGVGVESLGYAEGALLAGIISNPVSYDPTLHPEAATKRRRVALERLFELDIIDEEQLAEFSNTPLPVRRCDKDEPNRPISCGDVDLPPDDDYFVEAVKQQLLSDPRLGDTPEERFNAVFGGGLRIYTTLDPAMQRAAQEAHDSVPPANSLGVTSAIVSIDSKTGAVKALVGGPGFENYKFDVATHQPGRQTGSSFKVFVLLTALEQGNIPSDSIAGGGSFPNPGGTPNPYRIGGPGGSLTSVTTASSNGAFVRMGQVVGLENVILMARKLGVSSDLDPGIMSMPLGTALTTPLEMASAYTAIPNGGQYVPAFMVERIVDRTGTTIVRHERDEKRAFSERTACYATEILEANVRYGTGTRARLKNQEAAGKTGTTEENNDAWFVGFTPYLTTAVWMGNPDENVSMRNLGGVENFGGTYPAMIWRQFNETVHADLDPVAFPDCPKANRYARKVTGLGDGSANPGYTNTSKTTTTTKPKSAKDDDKDADKADDKADDGDDKQVTTTTDGSGPQPTSSTTATTVAPPDDGSGRRTG